jgi:D-glycero-alpha-D-manno-heptose-7-phosphate kinase
MIICRTPVRVSFFGGGTDYPAWYRRHGGEVLGTTIDKYSYITCRYLPPFFDYRYCIAYSTLEYTKTVDEIAHPAVREAVKYLGITRGLEIHHDGDLPARGGMGSSSAFTVGLLHALYALTGRMVGKRELALESVYLEQERLKETVGSQDQVLAAYGGLNHIVFQTNGEIVVTPVTIPGERMNELTSHLMLLYTGIRRTASAIADTYVRDLESRARELSAMRDLVSQSLALLNSARDIGGFGALLHEAWTLKRALGPSVSPPEVDDLYAEARRAGALGGKLTGAGGGGFFLVFAPPDRHAAIRDRLSRLIQVPFRPEFSGSQIIFADREQEYLEAEARRRLVAPFREVGSF